MSAQKSERIPDGLAIAALWVVVTLGLGAILMLGKEVIAPVFVAILLSFALSPIVRALQKVGVPRGLGAVMAIALFMAAIGVWVWFVSGQFTDLAQRLPSYQHNIHDKIHALTARFGGGGEKGAGVTAAVQDALKEVSPDAGAEKAPQRVVVVDDSPLSRISVLGAFASPVLSPLAQFLIILVFSAFLLAQQEDLRNRFIKLIGAHDLYRTTEAIDDAGGRIGRMLFAQVVMNGSFGTIISLSLWAIGVPNPALWGALAGIARFVPYIGVLIGMVPPLLVAFAFDPGWSAFLLTLGLFVAAESVTGQLIEPIVYGHSSGLSPTAVVFATAVWGFLWGPIGLVLATPLTTCMVVLGRHAPGFAFLETLLGDEPPLTAQETFYQRMLSGDPREAVVEARTYMKHDDLAGYYDEVALEALRRARVDVARGDLDDGRLKALTDSAAKLVATLRASDRKGGWRALLGWRTARAEQAARNRKRIAHRDVVVLHGEHPLDPAAAAMLAHALVRLGLPARVVSTQDALNATPAQAAGVGLVCLCFIDPLTVAHLRAASAGAHRRCPRAKVMICVWRDAADDFIKDMDGKLRCDAVATGIAAAGEAALRLLGLRPAAVEKAPVEQGDAPQARAA